LYNYILYNKSVRKTNEKNYDMNVRDVS
jgi:hypothetical protein